MAKAVVARQLGDDYQARWFWIEACRLFECDSPVERVGFEVDGAKAFDDVVTYYRPEHRVLSERGDPISADYLQIKFHVALSGSFTADALIDPAFINAQSVSLLERLRDAHRRHAPNGVNGVGARFSIVSPHGVEPHDKLADLVSSNGGELRLDRLFKGGPRTAMGQIRKRWSDSLGLVDERELEIVLRQLRIRAGAPSLERLTDHLNQRLAMAGLYPIDSGTRATAYDDLPRKLLREGRTQFDRHALDEILESEGLRRCPPLFPVPSARRLGIRSFMRWAEHMEDQSDAMRCFVADFDGRFLRDGRSWSEHVLPSLNEFLKKELGSGDVAHLQIDTHLSLAFAAGWELDSKSGVRVWPVQRDRGMQVWDASQSTCSDGGVWDSAGHEIDRGSAGIDGANAVAVVLSVARDIGADAEQYVQEHVGSVRHVLRLTACGGARQTAVRGGAHALRMAQDAVAAVVAFQRHTGCSGRTHVFAAAPNGLMFFLGQSARVLGSCVLYEHDFERRRGGSYEPSLILE